MILRLKPSDWFTKYQMGVALALVNLVALQVALPTEAREQLRPLKIVAFGDSLTAGYGLKRSQAFPAQLQRARKAKGHAVKVINAGVSGDTTGTGLARFAWAIPKDTDAVILELGANDALRGHDPKRTRTNLDKIITKLRARNIDVLIAGMVAPRSLGKAYTDAFDPIFSDLAKKHGQLYYPFFLDGVALDPKLNQSDGLHPTAAGIAVIVKRMLPDIGKLIDRARTRIARASKS